MSANEKSTDQHFFVECYVITLKCIIFIFLTIENQTFHHLRQFAKQT